MTGGPEPCSDRLRPEVRCRAESGVCVFRRAWLTRSPSLGLGFHDPSYSPMQQDRPDIDTVRQALAGTDHLRLNRLEALGFSRSKVRRHGTLFWIGLDDTTCLGKLVIVVLGPVPRRAGLRCDQEAKGRRPEGSPRRARSRLEAGERHRSGVHRQWGKCRGPRGGEPGHGDTEATARQPTGLRASCRYQHACDSFRVHRPRCDH